MDTSYLPVQYVYREIIADEIARGTTGKVIYFGKDESLECAEGTITGVEDIPGEGVFITLSPEARVRIDRIITLFGKPSAAFDEYDAAANACMDCRGGYEPD